MKICSMCKESKHLDDFSWRNKSKGTKHSACKVCKRSLDNAKYAAGGRSGSTLEQAKAIRQRNNDFILEVLKTNPCKDCGIDDVRVLEFDHLRDKEINISQLRSCSLERLAREMEKCDVVCANCHKIRTYSRMNSCYRMMA